MPLLLLALVACGGADPEALAEAEAARDAAQAELAAAQEELTALQEKLETCTCPEPEPEVTEAAPKEGGGTLGQLEVKSPSAVKAVLDGKDMRYSLKKAAYVADDIPAGTHLLEIEGTVQRVSVSESVRIEGGKRTRYQFKMVGKSLEKLGSVPAE